MRRDDPILRKCREVLDALYGPRLKGLILFGSTARGTDTPESDIDLLVLLEGPVQAGEEVYRMTDALFPLQLDSDRLISVMPADAEEYQKGESNLYQNVLEEGVPI
jgi:predicted nucleotidyltransferase